MKRQAIRRLRARVSAQVLKEYDIRKRRYGASSVVAIEGDICTGCQVHLSLKTQRQARYRVIECEHCGRLIYNPSRCQRLCIEIDVPTSDVTSPTTGEAMYAY